MTMSKRTAVIAIRKATDAMSVDHQDLNARKLTEAILACQPSGCSGAELFKWSYLGEEILSKYCDNTTTPSSVRETRAIEKMLKSEKSCQVLNVKGLPEFSSKAAIMYRASQLVAEILGSIDRLYDDMDGGWSFTSGATTCRKRRMSDPFYKWHSSWSLDVTPAALPIAKYMADGTPLWKYPEPITCDGNVVFTVPKSCDIDRAACKEPALNQALQSCVGKFIRRKLLRFGINLNDQTRNQTLAKLGSRSGRLCTIDLKSASDSISQRIVYELLPPEWVEILDSLRSPKGQLPNGKWVTWEKHSTMGNGYTFELESLIFYALVKATIDITKYNRRNIYYSSTAWISVYGDDIICPSHYYSNVVTTLNACGFLVNEKKSFHTGPFRESCGGHFYNGYDVKPFYIRKPIDSIDRLIWLLNALRQWCSDGDGWCDPSVYSLWLRLRRKFCPPCLLGGRDLQSTSEVVSPHEPRFSAYWAMPKKPIDGVRAVLRWFQYNNMCRSHESIRIKYRRETFVDQTLDPVTGQIVDFNNIVDLGSRQTLRVSKYKPSLLSTSIFPQECGEAGGSIGSDLPMVG